MRTIPTRWQELTAQQRDVLLALAHEQPVSGGEINRQLGREQSLRSAIHRVLQTHEQAGLVTLESENGPNNRREWALTDDGEELLAAVGRLWDETNVQVAP